MGTYLVSSATDTHYFTQIIGDAKKPSTLASSSFNGFAVIDADPHIPNGWGAQWFTNQNDFSWTSSYRSVLQGTSLINIVVEMSTASNNNHQGKYGIQAGNLMMSLASGIGVMIS
ncbi:hypothetical protein BDR06DRAFT_975623 [Suillus hirtellus]|nr:hypothetical protein BDR06DRAFT_975623 [Suillus hirtellus]